ncbi:MAG: GYD domain-containing protein [Thaumarchaeota archaeon]|nr:GYD domain-containing protein [Nitrososphaerota archaeon]
MIFVMLAKFRRKPRKEDVRRTPEILTRNGAKQTLAAFWTFGRYDAVLAFEADNEDAAMKIALEFSDLASIETLIAVPREQALQLLD